MRFDRRPEAPSVFIACVFPVALLRALDAEGESKVGSLCSGRAEALSASLIRRGRRSCKRGVEEDGKKLSNRERRLRESWVELRV